MRQHLTRALVAVLIVIAFNGAGLADADKRKSILIGSELDYPPYALVTENGEADGFSVDLIKAVAGELGIDIKFRVAPWNEVKTHLERGEVDLLPHVYYSQERDKSFDFSVTHTSADAAIFARKGERQNLTVNDLRQITVIAMQSDWTHEYLVSNGLIDNVTLVDTIPEALRLLSSEKYDVAFLPHLVGHLLIRDLGLTNIEIAGDLVPVGRGFAFAVHEGDFELLQRLNEGLAIIKASGRYDEIYEKWFGIVDSKGVSRSVVIRYAAWTGAGVVILTAMIFVWVIVLRRTVAQQTAELRLAHDNLELRVTERTVELRESKAQKDLVFKTLPDLIWVKDVQGSYLACNPMFERHFGAKEAEIIGKTDYDFIDSELADFCHEKDKKVVMDDSPLHCEEWITFADDGRRALVETVKTPLKDDDGTITGILGISREITERKALEEQLRQSQKMEAVGQLTGGIAHDFNNILNIVMGKAELLSLRVEGNEKALSDTEAIIGAVKRAASLTERLLAFSRQQTLSPEPTEACSLINGLGDMLHRTLGETIELHADLESMDCIVLIDSHQFENALINLAINARDAMPNGGALTIKIANVTLDDTYAEQHFEVTPGDYLEVTVADTGTGMPPEVLEKVFDPFFTTKGVGEGSGLGLSMVYGFAMQSNGYITIDSEEGHGTTVNLYLPRCRKVIVQEEGGDEAPKFAPGSGRILLVEDDEAVREIPTSILRDQGYEVFEARDGEEAIKLLKENQPFDLLFTDVVLPGGKNGVEISNEAKRIQSNIKVLYTTGYPQDAFTHSDTAVLDGELLNKPYRRAELLEKVQGILGGAGD